MSIGLGGLSTVWHMASIQRITARRRDSSIHEEELMYPAQPSRSPWSQDRIILMISMVKIITIPHSCLYVGEKSRGWVSLPGNISFHQSLVSSGADLGPTVQVVCNRHQFSLVGPIREPLAEPPGGTGMEGMEGMEEVCVGGEDFGWGSRILFVHELPSFPRVAFLCDPQPLIT